MVFTSTSAGQKISTFRKIKSFEHIEFAKEVQHQLSIEVISKINAQECINIYHRILRTTLDNRAPLKSKVTSHRPKLPWYNDEIGEAIHRHHKAEQVWNNDITNTNKFLNFYRFRRQVTNLLNESECTYYKNSLHESEQDSKKCLKSVIHSWNVTLAFHYHLYSVTMN